MMRSLKNLFLFLVFMAPFHAHGSEMELYEDKIIALEKNGHIETLEAQKKLYKLKVKTSSDQSNLKNQARGVASAIKAQKVIKFVNDPIEVSVD